MAQKIVEFPKSLLVRIANHGTDEEYLAVGESPSDIGDDIVEKGTVRTARYVLVGTGVIHHSAPEYVEDAKA